MSQSGTAKTIANDKRTGDVGSVAVKDLSKSVVFSIKKRGEEKPSDVRKFIQAYGGVGAVKARFPGLKVDKYNQDGLKVPGYLIKILRAVEDGKEKEIMKWWAGYYRNMVETGKQRADLMNKLHKNRKEKESKGGKMQQLGGYDKNIDYDKSLKAREKRKIELTRKIDLIKQVHNLSVPHFIEQFPDHPYPEKTGKQAAGAFNNKKVTGASAAYPWDLAYLDAVLAADTDYSIQNQTKIGLESIKKTSTKSKLDKAVNGYNEAKEAVKDAVNDTDFTTPDNTPVSKSIHSDAELQAEFRAMVDELNAGYVGYKFLANKLGVQTIELERAYTTSRRRGKRLFEKVKERYLKRKYQKEVEAKEAKKKAEAAAAVIQGPVEAPVEVAVRPLPTDLLPTDRGLVLQGLIATLIPRFNVASLSDQMDVISDITRAAKRLDPHVQRERVKKRHKKKGKRYKKSNGTGLEAGSVDFD